MILTAYLWMLIAVSAISSLLYGLPWLISKLKAKREPAKPFDRNTQGFNDALVLARSEIILLRNRLREGETVTELALHSLLDRLESFKKP